MNTSLAGIGHKIRALRKSKGLTVAVVAERARVSKGLISQIENGRTVPSLPVFVALLKALEANSARIYEYLLQEMFNAEEQRPYQLIKSGEFHVIEKEKADGFVYHYLLSQHLDAAALEVCMLTLLPAARRQPVQTDAFEVKYLLTGEVEYQIGDETVTMHEGDLLVFDGNIPHVPLNKTSQPARMLVIYLYRGQ